MGLLDHVKIENLDEDQRKMVELVGLDGIRRSGKNLTEEIIESLPRNMDLPSAG